MENLWKSVENLWFQPCGNHLSTSIAKNASGGTARSLEQLKNLLPLLNRIPNLLPESNRQCWDVNHNKICPFFSLETIYGIYHIEFPILIAISRFGKPLHMCLCLRGLRLVFKKLWVPDATKKQTSHGKSFNLNGICCNINVNPSTPPHQETNLRFLLQSIQPVLCSK